MRQPIVMPGNVMPAKAGIQFARKRWDARAFLDARVRGHDKVESYAVP